MDPFALLLQHSDITLVRTALPDGEMGRWYPAQRTIVLHDALTQREARCTLTHELMHALKADFHIDDPWLAGKQERACQELVARALIPLERLATEGRICADDHQLAEVLDVDLDTLRVRIDSLTDGEIAVLHGADEDFEEIA